MGDVFDGLTIVVSGKFSRSQGEMKNLVTENGGSVGGSVTAKTDYLVSSEMGTSKWTSAKAKGIPIVTEEWLVESAEKGSISTDPAHYTNGGPPSGAGAAKPKPAKKAAAPKRAARGKAKKKDEDDEEEEKEDEEEEEEEEKPKRGTKRKAPSSKAAKPAKSSGSAIFDGLVFCVSGKMSRSQAEVQGLVVANGGKVAGTVSKAVTHVVAPALGSSKTNTAVDRDLPVVKEAWLDASIEGGAPSTDASLFLSGGPGSSSSSSSSSMPAKSTKDDQDDEDYDDDDEPKKKKAKAAPKKRVAAKKKAKVEEEDDDEEEEEEKESKSSGSKVSVTVQGLVDPPCPLAKEAHVYKEGDVVYDALLNQTNIGKNNNKFYIIQLLQSDTNSSQFWAWNRWGRVGASGQKACVGPTSLAAAKKAFEAKFYDKTRNRWDARDDFSPVSGKYTYLKRDYDDQMPEDKSTGEKKEFKQVDSKLDKRVQDLVKLICNVELMTKTLVQMDYDPKQLPLGKISKDTIQKGYKALKDIADELKGKRRANVLTDLSNVFYSYVPHNFGYRPAEIINTEARLKKKLEMVENLADIEIATKIISQNGDGSVNPVDVHYNKLNCAMQPLEHKSEEMALLRKYLKNTHGSTHDKDTLEIEDVFVLDRDGEEKRYHGAGSEKVDPRMLLWHGSRLTNYVGILSQGLRIAPPEAPVTGYMFGKGVYFADMVSKSANYCFTDAKNTTGLMLLCEVALGDLFKLKQADYYADINKKNSLSTMGMGKYGPNPKEFEKLPDGTIVPCGKQIDVDEARDSSLLYNEFIVYNVNQVKMKYLLKVKFNYKS